MRNPNEAALLISTQQIEKERTDWKNSTLLKTSAFGLNGFFFATHLVLNGKYLSSLGAEGSSASALMSTYQSVILGSGVGFLLATGLDFGTAVGKKEYQKAGEIAKTAVILSVVLGILSAAAMFSTRLIFPLLFENKTAQIALDFFTGYAAASLPLLFLIVAPQIAFQEGDWYIPPATMFSVLLISGVASYLLGFKTDLGAFGVGIGGTIGSSLTAAVLLLWSLKNNYSKYVFYSRNIDHFSEKMKNLLSLGWKLSLQRLTEWGNLLTITTIVGLRSNNDLTALNPAMLYLILFGTAQQGFAQAAGMVIAKNKGAIQKAIEDNDTNSIIRYHQNNIKAIFRSNLFGLSLNSAIAFSFYFARAPLTKFFSSNDCAQPVLNLAENLLWINMLGLVFDACRIIGAGALRGWKDLLYPTVVSFIAMTLVGIPVAFGLGILLGDATKMMIYMRDFSMLISASFILKRCHHNVKKDETTELQGYIDPQPFFKTGLTLFNKITRKTENNEIDASLRIGK